MIDSLLLLANILRERGILVSTPEIIDSLKGLVLVRSQDVSVVKAVIKAAMVKDRDLSRVFDEAFETVFINPKEKQSTAGAARPGLIAGKGTDAGKGVGLTQKTTGKGVEKQRKTKIDNDYGYLPGEEGLLNLPFIAASPGQKRRMLALIKMMARKLAVKKGTGRKNNGSKLYFRKLWRKSLGTGGVPLELAWYEKRLNKPRLFIICDFSNSMSVYLPFVLEFVFTFAVCYSTVRVFGFVDSLEELTHRIDPVDIRRSIDNICSNSKITRRGLTDYGNALKGFHKYHHNELTGRTTVLIIGDARNNIFYSGADLLAKIRTTAARIYWLNPEDRSYWGTGDSYMDIYMRYCDGVFECRNINQLKKFAQQLYKHL
ncbi:VWA domain-containing protein [Desulfallas sp. Bu1-1]|uniref:VWA domain-containing protein n=1 Tax=Desulfallas sp. Bu1-1 TaxID=2787620 RepID=UPI00189EF6EB|nr:VWA domain-containing protein [Desulfallas sp. Bu1-1]MBF7082931.1 VWA domain-containing protein [Desulfallas sp. Bu1-1]